MTGAILPGAANAADYVALSGRQLYERFCASCHGVQGRGDGPVADSLRVEVPDLTRIAQRRGAALPRDRIARIIDGRHVLKAHGSRTMPVWGEDLSRAHAGDPDAERNTEIIISRLAEYVWFLQRPGDQDVPLAAQAPDAPAGVDQWIHAALELDRNAERGALLYEQHCADCHGGQAWGDAARSIPALAGQRRAYLVKQLADFIELERRGDQEALRGERQGRDQGRSMHEVVSSAGLDDPQVWADIAAYVNGLPLAQSTQTGDGTGLALGEAVYREQCATCHEEDARGDDEGFVPSLRNQHYVYLLRQMRGLTAWHRSNADEGLIRFLDSLETEEMTAVADYLSRFRGPVRDRLRMHNDGTVGD
ncbi:hypothetical protein ACG33_03990 [Steroidobacter denitrificans]|uniref:Cytochrome c domain-containing protein n=2 Tax=Steroidobacter denitrificans TaxID=465721 RepID=A0A127F9L4_STEDE|nr:hypothetical protein ACG33_03990 [Steroidobacter denitrificans]